jgi:hypothetical protein
LQNGWSAIELDWKYVFEELKMAAADEVINEEVVSKAKIAGSSCASGTCPLSNKAVMAFVLPFLAAIVLEQVVFKGSPCFGAVCLVNKTMVPILAGFAGLAFQRAFLKTSK